MCSKSLQLCLTLCDPMDFSPPSSSVKGILQARILEWVAMLSWGSSRPQLILVLWGFLAVLGLHCRAQAFSSCGEWGLLSSCGARTSHCGGFSCCGAQALGRAGFSSCSLQALEHRFCSRVCLVALWHVGSSQTRDQTHVPCIGRWILNHRTTREVPSIDIFK